MIVDTSALVAIVLSEAGADRLARALFAEAALVPAVVHVEFARVTFKPALGMNAASERLLHRLREAGVTFASFEAADAEAAITANPTYGSGNRSGGKLNMLDLMVYGMAKRLGRPVLCTGTDFATTDIDIHPASRRW